MKFIRRLASLALLIVALGAHAAGGDYVDRSGTITSGGVSQTLAAANTERGNITIYNLSTETEVLCVNVTAAASCSTAGSWHITPGGSITLTTKEQVNVIAATTGHKFTAKENVLGGFALANTGTASISGGAGDASAANQVTGNNTLASIDGKTPSLVSGRQPVTDLTAVAQASTTSGQSGNLIQCATTTSAPTYTTGQTNPVNCDTSGAIRITGSISAGGVAQGSTTSGQTGGLTQAAVTTAAPSYTTGQTSPLSLDTAGALRVTGNFASGVAQGSTTSGQVGGLTQAAVTTAAPSYTNAQTSPLSLTTAGALRTDASATTQPVSGTVAATQSGTWSTRTQDGSGNAITSATRGSERAISVQIVDGSGAQVTTFGGSGGTASTVGSAVPSSATAAGASDGTNMRIPRVFDTDTGGGTEYTLGVNVRLGASGGGVELTGGAGAVAAGTLRTTQASDSPMVAATGATSDSVCSTDTGTCTLIALVKRTNQQVSASNPQLPTALGATTASGSLSVTLATDGTNIVTQGSTTSGQRGGLMQGAVTTSAPSYTTAQTSPLSLDTAGNLRVAVSGGAGSTISGSTAHDAAGSAVNPVATGGYASAAAPTDVSADTDIVRDWNLRSGAKVVQPSYAGVLATTGNGASGTGVARVTIASDSTGQVALAAGSATIGALTANQSVNVAQINGVTPLMGAGNTGTGSHRVTLATDQAAIATAGHGATGAAVPSGATQMGVRTGANMEAATQGSTTVAINVSTATTTQLVALSGSTLIRVTGMAVVAGGAGNITFVYGTGSSCGTGTTSISGAIPLVANVGFTMGAGLGPVLIIPAGQALCITTSAAVQMSGFLTYAQY